MLDGFGWPHLLIIAVLLVVLFGAKRLPGAAKGIGQSLRIFKSEVGSLTDDPPAEQPQPAPAAPRLAAQPPVAPLASAPVASVPASVPVASAPPVAPAGQQPV